MAQECFGVTIEQAMSHALSKEVASRMQPKPPIPRFNKKNQVPSLNLNTAVPQGRTLFIGEGNFSFSYGLALQADINPRDVVATEVQKRKELSKDAHKNVARLAALGATVLFRVNATHLHEIFSTERKFRSILFLFPNTASRKPIYKRNANHILLRRFLSSASAILEPGGKIYITLVDSPYYHAAFKVDEAMKYSPFNDLKKYEFNLDDYPYYKHTKTHENESGICDYNNFCTFVYTRI